MLLLTNGPAFALEGHERSGRCDFSDWTARSFPRWHSPPGRGKRLRRPWCSARRPAHPALSLPGALRQMTQLARVNCRVGKVSLAYSRTIRGLVIGQKPKLGAVLPGREQGRCRDQPRGRS